MSHTLHAPPAQSDTLVSRCQNREEDAWTELVQRYGPLVRMIASSFGLRRADVEDIAQQTWIRVYEGIRSVREPDRVRAWIVTVTRREALRHLNRRTNGELPIGDQQYFDVADEQASPERHVLLGAELDAALAVVAKLPEAQRRLLILLFGAQAVSYDEISARLGIPRGSIGPTRARLLRQLQYALDGWRS
ncbi:MULTISPECIES: RNA polymerase sigma factor [unclassified Crossiella]|uniref:RNA polymerase sigma factor n=1 Tax=unclassified Crossiella TaxID=2620835 RepID=UPI001FFE5B51|nr:MULTISPECIES: sigma-70 family RNA polymerase sigma factor [unclassified Crossiella]MCK2239822.1 sigma-70 family RNA polymerase sigma factor [Crossiella sp. S99.2]MCK2252517.1 sigma-70 family RNA polymerase sigma factor [Crossiella sp. S99.1]